MAKDDTTTDTRTPWITDFLDRAYFEGWALALTFGTVEEARAGRLGYAVACAVMSALCQFVVVRWGWLKHNANPRFVATTHKIVTDARWWISTLMVFLAFLALSPYVEQGRWPFSQTATTLGVASSIAPVAPMSEEERQYRRDLRKFVLSPLTAANNGFEDVIWG
jgi:hypothetical protein